MILFSIERATQRAALARIRGRAALRGRRPVDGVRARSWLDRDGKPEVAIATFAVPADSPRLVESKLGEALSHRVQPDALRWAVRRGRHTRARPLSCRGARQSTSRSRPRARTERRHRAELPGECLDELPHCCRALRARSRGARRPQVRSAAKRSTRGSFVRCARSRDNPTTPACSRLSRGARSIPRDCCATSCRSAGIPGSTSIASSGYSPTSGGAAAPDDARPCTPASRAAAASTSIPIAAATGGGPPAHARSSAQ